jgi:GNAT superfamily N-acetyltransferase
MNLADTFLNSDGTTYRVYHVDSFKKTEVYHWFWHNCQILKDSGHAHPGWNVDDAEYGGIVITNDQTPVAHLAARVDSEMKLLFDSFIYIEPQYRSKGLAHHLMNHLSIWGKKIGLRAMIGTIHFDNQKSLDFFSNRKDCKIMPYHVFVQTFNDRT